MSGQNARVFQDWFQVWEAEPGLHVIAEPFHFENVRSYLIEGRDRALLVDTGMGIGDIKSLIDEITTLPVSVLNSHAHWDHIGGNWRFSEIAIHRLEATDLERPRVANLAEKLSAGKLFAPLPPGVDVRELEIKSSRATTLLEGGEKLDLGGRLLEIVHAPGHSPGGIVVADRENAFMLTTDVVYEAPMYAHLATSDVAAYLQTLRTLERAATGLDRLYPSHDRTPVEPELIGQARAALEEIVNGRVPDEVEGNCAAHRFGEFGFYVRADDPALRIRS